MKKNRLEGGYYQGIINPYNGHNRELVDMICDAWEDVKYHFMFADILYALGCRDRIEIIEKFDIVINDNESAMENAHEIMEYVCDDVDLQTILSFIRYDKYVNKVLI